MHRNPTPPKTEIEAVVRGMRHEVCDYLQSVYAAVALLEQEFEKGAGANPRQLLVALKRQSKELRCLIDHVHDLFCNLQHTHEAVDLSELLQDIIKTEGGKVERVSVKTDIQERILVVTNPALLSSALAVLIKAALYETTDTLHVELTSDAREIRLHVRDNSTGSPIERTGKDINFLTSHFQGYRGLLMNLLRRAVEGLKGEVSISTIPSGGVVSSIKLPIYHPPQGGIEEAEI